MLLESCFHLLLLPMPLFRKEMLLLTTEEVVEQVEEALGRTGEPVQVILPDPPGPCTLSSCSGGV